MTRHLNDDKTVVSPEKYALLGPTVEVIMELLRQAQKQEKAKIQVSPKKLFNTYAELESLHLPAFPADTFNSYEISVEMLSQMLTELLIQVGSTCQHSRPTSTISHNVGPNGSYFKCGHSNPPHYWDNDGNLIPRP